MKHFFSLVVIFFIVASSAFQTMAAPVQGRQPTLTLTPIFESTASATTSLRPHITPVEQDPYKRMPDPYKRAPEAEDPYKRTPEADPYKRTPEADPYKRTPEADPYRRTPEADPYKRTPEADPYKRTPEKQDPYRRTMMAPY